MQDPYSSVQVRTSMGRWGCWLGARAELRFNSDDVTRSERVVTMRWNRTETLDVPVWPGDALSVRLGFAGSAGAPDLEGGVVARIPESDVSGSNLLIAIHKTSLVLLYARTRVTFGVIPSATSTEDRAWNRD